ncbi:MAG: acetylglutamate kinase [candidate division WS1 bacterium]|jgi:acetylglutamate kinase|nr:acetylglutamate kinase [candidate division WS1 bacterium]
MSGQNNIALRAQVLIEALPYIQEFRGARIVVKYGGAAMVDEELKRSVCQDVALLHYVGIKPIVVHGGGKKISEVMERLGLQPQFIEGLRVTDDATMEVAEMVLVGTIAQDLASHIQAAGVSAVTLSGRDGCTLGACRIPGPNGADLGRVGEVTSIDTRLINDLIEAGHIPVISPIGRESSGAPLNINADTAAGALAGKVGARKLVTLSDVPGLLRDREDPSTLISQLTLSEAREMLTSDAVGSGMIPKLQSCITAVEGGVERAHMIDGSRPHSLLIELFSEEGIGTMVVGD